MRKSCILAILFCVLGSSVLALTITQTANVSCRTRSDYPNTNRSDSSKLTVRSSDRGEKSWIKFDITSVDVDRLRGAELRLTLHADKSGTQFFNVSTVNDDCLDNIGWAEGDLTWMNAPGNNTSSYADLDPTKTTHLTQVDFVNGVAGQQFFIDILAILQADTDNIVQFALHYSSGDLNLSTHDHPMGEEYYPKLFLTYPPEGADFPDPEDGATVETSLPSLSWTNPEPNLPGQPIYCDVYLGMDPNRPQMDKVTLGNDVSSVDLNGTNFPNFILPPDYKLENQTTYYWVVDCYDTVKGLIPGEFWSFYTDDNEAPYNVNAGEDVVTWLDPNVIVVNLVGTAEDDGLPEDPGTLTITWAQVDNGAPASAVIDPTDALSTSITFTEAGDYEFRLTADDGALQTSDTIRIVVGETPCDASHINTGDPYNPGDANQDCIVDLSDLQELIVDDWLECSNTLGDCY